MLTAKPEELVVGVPAHNNQMIIIIKGCSFSDESR
jgi:hypothetical protein